MDDVKEKKNYCLGKILIIGVIVCVLLLLFSVTIFRYKLNKDLEVRCEKIRAAGEPITLRELDKFYGEVPDDENAALIYEDIFSLLYIDSYHVYDMYVDEAAAKGITEDKLEFKTFDAFQDNILFLSCDVDVIADEKMEQKVKDATRIFLNANKRCLELSRKTERYSKCKFNFGFKKGYILSLTHLVPSKDYAQFLAVDMSYSALIGDSDRVLKDFREGIKLSEYLQNEPTLFSYMYGNEIDEILIDALKKSFSRVQFTDLQLKEIESILNEHIKGMSMYRAYTGQRVLSLSNIDKCKSAELYNKVLYKLAPFCGLDILWKLKRLDLIDEFLKIEDEIDFTKKRKLFDDCWKKFKNLSFIYEPFKPMGSGCFFTTMLKVRAKLTTALIAIKIERYRLKYQNLPKDLNALVPEFFQKLPIDLFSGKSYKYRVGEFYAWLQDTFYDIIEMKLDGFIVYSVGINGVDDKGKEEDKHGDIVYWVIDKEKNQNINKVFLRRKENRFITY